MSNLSALSSDRPVYLFISDILLFSSAQITPGYPNRTVARCHPGDKNHKKLALVFTACGWSAATSNPLCPRCDFCLICESRASTDTSQSHFLFHFLGCRGDECWVPLHAVWDWLAWYDLTPSPHWKLEMFSTCAPAGNGRTALHVCISADGRKTNIF